MESQKISKRLLLLHIRIILFYFVLFPYYPSKQHHLKLNAQRLTPKAFNRTSENCLPAALNVRRLALSF